MSPIVNLDVVKDRNISAVYKTILTHGAIPRTEIARICQIAPGSVTRITRQLMDNGLIEEVVNISGSDDRGRKAMPLAINKNRIQILAARIGRTHLHIGLQTVSGEILAKHSEPLPIVKDNGPSQEQFSKQVISALTAFIQKHKKLVTKIAGVGLAVPGLVDVQEGVITFMPHLKVNNLPLAELISDVLDAPCHINNFIAAMTLAEKQFGALKDYQNSLLVSIHNGVGAGLVMDGKLYEGSSAAVGELGHIQMEPLGQQCDCGNFGCLETVVSNSAIEKRCRQILPTASGSSLAELPTGQITITDICTAANHGDALAIRLLKEAAAKLGSALAMAVNLLRPQVIALSGELCQAADIVHPVIEQCLKQQAVNVPGIPPVKVINAKLYDRPWLAGYSLIRKAITDQGLLWQIMKEAQSN
ncbi:ROK family protein [Sansalvadorimonas verongulae]|uniref:ROK family protein n=1 Tax=Sansalvadorimonas verongulae TaxID=2172824 RepID=UPI0012BCA5A4|nr:ROK family protein [Sansalvadorimonas verongulae]MTI11994.1 ROK family protein [Sansalvadorimonas verongulae]